MKARLQIDCADSQFGFPHPHPRQRLVCQRLCVVPSDAFLLLCSCRTSLWMMTTTLGVAAVRRVPNLYCFNAESDEMLALASALIQARLDDASQT